MDKNTLTGLVLMTAVMFGFFWFTKPSEEELAAQRAQQEQEAKEALEAAQKQNELAATPFSAADSSALIQAVREMGTPQGEAVNYTSEKLALTVGADGKLSGTYKAGDALVPVADIMAGTSKLSVGDAVKASAELRDMVAKAAKYQGFARYLNGENKEVVLENELVKVTLQSRGGRVAQVELKKYKTERTPQPTNILMFRDEADAYGFAFNTADQHIDTRDFNFTPVMEGDSAVQMVLNPADGASWAVRYVLDKEGYNVRMQVLQKGMNKILPANTASMDFNWHQKMARNEVGKSFEQRNSAIYYKYVGEGVDDLSSSGDKEENLAGKLRWVAFKNQFFSSVIIAHNPFTAADLTSKDLKDDNEFLKDMTMKATVPYTPADGVAATFDFYFGPNDYPLLSSMDDKLAADEDLQLTRLIPLGWTLFRWINTWIVIPVFTFLGSFISSYGLIIFLLTLFIKLIIFPFTYKSFKSQAKMRVLAPEIKEINDKYPDQEDALKRQQETMALYSRAGASPMSGCLPMLLQMPVLIAMFSFFPSAIELRGQSFLWAHDLSAPDYILTLPFSIPFYGSQVSLFCLLMTVINIVYMKISMSSQPQNAAMPGMKAMQYMMPVMFLFMFNDYASGLSYYYLLSLLITIIQTYIFRYIIDEKKVRAQLLENAKKPRKKSGWMARLEEAQKQAQAAQRAQAKANAKRRR